MDSSSFNFFRLQSEENRSTYLQKVCSLKNSRIFSSKNIKTNSVIVTFVFMQLLRNYGVFEKLLAAITTITIKTCWHTQQKAERSQHSWKTEKVFESLSKIVKNDYLYAFFQHKSYICLEGKKENTQEKASFYPIFLPHWQHLAAFWKTGFDDFIDFG